MHTYAHMYMHVLPCTHTHKLTHNLFLSEVGKASFVTADWQVSIGRAGLQNPSLSRSSLRYALHAVSHTQTLFFLNVSRAWHFQIICIFSGMIFACTQPTKSDVSLCNNYPELQIKERLLPWAGKKSLNRIKVCVACIQVCEGVSRYIQRKRKKK